MTTQANQNRFITTLHAQGLAVLFRQLWCQRARRKTAVISRPDSIPVCQAVPARQASAAKNSALAAQAALQPGHSSLGSVLSFGQRRAGRVLERAREVLAPMLVELAERELDAGA